MKQIHVLFLYGKKRNDQGYEEIKKWQSWWYWWDGRDIKNRHRQSSTLFGKIILKLFESRQYAIYIWNKVFDGKSKRKVIYLTVIITKVSHCCLCQTKCFKIQKGVEKRLRKEQTVLWPLMIKYPQLIWRCIRGQNPD